MAITWLAAFADVPAPRVPDALTFWSAVTASTPREAAGDHDEYLPLAADGEDAYLWIQRVHRPEPKGFQPETGPFDPEIKIFSCVHCFLKEYQGRNNNIEESKILRLF